jgi:hypothetical protein
MPAAFARMFGSRGITSDQRAPALRSFPATRTGGGTFISLSSWAINDAAASVVEVGLTEVVEERSVPSMQRRVFCASHEGVEAAW